MSVLLVAGGVLLLLAIVALFVIALGHAAREDDE